MPEKGEIGGQEIWIHDSHDIERGYFHTYDNLQLEGYPPRKVHVFLPRDYLDMSSSGIKFPVIFSHDGQNVFFGNSEGGKGIRTAQVLHEVLNRIGENYLQPIIIGVHPVDRDNEYTHEKMVEDAGGNLEDFTSYFCDFLVPFFERNYSISTNIKEKTIWGCSHGGLAAFYMATRRNDCFGNAICMSSSFWVGMDSSAEDPLKGFQHLRKSKLITDIKNILADKENRPRIYIDWGLHRMGFHNFLTEFFACKRGREMAEILRFDFDYLEFSYHPHHLTLEQHQKDFPSSLYFSSEFEIPPDIDEIDLKCIVDTISNDNIQNGFVQEDNGHLSVVNNDENSTNDNEDNTINQCDNIQQSNESDDNIQDKITISQGDAENNVNNDNQDNQSGDGIQQSDENTNGIQENNVNNDNQDNSINQNGDDIQQSDGKSVDISNDSITIIQENLENKDIQDNSTNQNEDEDNQHKNKDEIQDNINTIQDNTENKVKNTDLSNGIDIGRSINPAFSELMVIEDALGGHDEDAWNYRLFDALAWLITGINDKNLV